MLLLRCCWLAQRRARTLNQADSQARPLCCAVPSREESKPSWKSCTDAANSTARRLADRGGIIYRGALGYANRSCRASLDDFCVQRPSPAEATTPARREEARKTLNQLLPAGAAEPDHQTFQERGRKFFPQPVTLCCHLNSVGDRSGLQGERACRFGRRNF